MSPTIDLTLDGPTEREWARVCDRLPPFVWPACRRLVVVSPHPDDESLGAGGLIGAALERGLPVRIVAVTDGEAAGDATPDPVLARIRRDELSRAMTRLDPSGSIVIHRLGLPDSAVATVLDSLVTGLVRVVDRHDLVVCPLPDDGHPDHAAVSLAATAAATAAGAAVRWFPVWAWHCHDPGETPLRRAQRLPLSAAVSSRKRSAVGCYASQLEGRSPVVPAAMLVRLLRDFEVLVDPDGA